MKQIPLTQGKYTIVDDDDYEFLKWDKWLAHKRGGNWYAETSDPNKKSRMILMHRVILNAQPGQSVDHINGNGLDNRKENIRICTQSDNAKNRKKNGSSSSKYKGVYECKYILFKRYRAFIGKSRYLGYFKMEEEAARAYDKAAKELYGAFARLNFPEEK